MSGYHLANKHKKQEHEVRMQKKMSTSVSFLHRYINHLKNEYFARIQKHSQFVKISKEKKKNKAEKTYQKMPYSLWVTITDFLVE